MTHSPDKPHPLDDLGHVYGADQTPSVEPGNQPAAGSTAIEDLYRQNLQGPDLIAALRRDGVNATQYFDYVARQQPEVAAALVFSGDAQRAKAALEEGGYERPLRDDELGESDPLARTQANPTLEPPKHDGITHPKVNWGEYDPGFEAGATPASAAPAEPQPLKSTPLQAAEAKPSFDDSREGYLDAPSTIFERPGLAERRGQYATELFGAMSTLLDDPNIDNSTLWDAVGVELTPEGQAHFDARRALSSQGLKTYDALQGLIDSALLPGDVRASLQEMVQKGVERAKKPEPLESSEEAWLDGLSIGECELVLIPFSKEVRDEYWTHRDLMNDSGRRFSFRDKIPSMPNVHIPDRLKSRKAVAWGIGLVAAATVTVLATRGIHVGSGNSQWLQHQEQLMHQAAQHSHQAAQAAQHAPAAHTGGLNGNALHHALETYAQGHPGSGAGGNAAQHLANGVGSHGGAVGAPGNGGDLAPHIIHNPNVTHVDLSKVKDSSTVYEQFQHIPGGFHEATAEAQKAIANGELEQMPVQGHPGEFFWQLTAKGAHRIGAQPGSSNTKDVMQLLSNYANGWSAS